jgi:hypothetical protein
MKSLVLVLVVAFVLIAENAVLATDLQPGTLCQIDEKVMFRLPGEERNPACVVMRL